MDEEVLQAAKPRRFWFNSFSISLPLSSHHAATNEWTCLIMCSMLIFLLCLQSTNERCQEVKRNCPGMPACYCSVH